MAPKLWRGAKPKEATLKRPAAGKVSEPTGAIKGLAGFRKASRVFTGAVDKGVSQQSAALASRAVVLEGLDARLVCIDPAKNSDRYYVLQGLEDTKIPEVKPKRFYAYQRWGRTGTGGVCRLQGPMEQKKVERHLFSVFKAKTGMAWGSGKPGEKAAVGKYWLAHPSEADPRAVWEYYVDDGVDHKRNDWYPYDEDASKQVEELYAEHVANKGGKNATAKRFVDSGTFTYCIDLQALTQRNTSTGMERQIRRAKSSASSKRTDASSPDALFHQPSPRSDSSAGLFRADTAETIPAAWNDAQFNAQLAGPGKASVKRSLSSSSGREKRMQRSTSCASSIPGLPGKRARPARIVAPTSVGDMRKLVQSGEVERLTHPMLRTWLSARNITSSGTKMDLVERVYCVLIE